MNKYEVKRQPKQAILVIVILLVLAAACMAVAAFGILFRSLFQAAALCLIVAAILIAERHLFSSFTYILHHADEGWELVVTRSIAGRTRTECRVLFSQITGYRRASGADRKPKDGEPPRCYDYTENMRPDPVLLLFLGDDASTVKLEPDDTFCERLTGLLTPPEDPEYPDL